MQVVIKTANILKIELLHNIPHKERVYKVKFSGVFWDPDKNGVVDEWDNDKEQNTPQNAQIFCSDKNFWVYYYTQMSHMVSSGTILQW